MKNQDLSLFSVSLLNEGVRFVNVGRGSDDSLFALVDGRVKFERLGRDRKKVSVYAVEQ